MMFHDEPDEPTSENFEYAAPGFPDNLRSRISEHIKTREIPMIEIVMDHVRKNLTHPLSVMSEEGLTDSHSIIETGPFGAKHTIARIYYNEDGVQLILFHYDNGNIVVEYEYAAPSFPDDLLYRIRNHDSGYPKRSDLTYPGTREN